jgi:hypothetical protein
MTRTAGGGRDVGTVGRMLKARRDRLSWGSASVLWHICRRLCDVSTGTGVCRASPYGRRAQERGCRASSTSFTPVSTPQQLGLVHSRSLFTQTLCHRRARRLHHRRVQCMGSAVHIALSKLSIRGHTLSLSRSMSFLSLVSSVRLARLDLFVLSALVPYPCPCPCCRRRVRCTHHF